MCGSQQDSPLFSRVLLPNFSEGFCSCLLRVMFVSALAITEHDPEQKANKTQAIPHSLNWHKRTLAPKEREVAQIIIDSKGQFLSHTLQCLPSKITTL
jgi:hypothetical protein